MVERCPKARTQFALTGRDGMSHEERWAVVSGEPASHTEARAEFDQNANRLLAALSNAARRDVFENAAIRAANEQDFAPSDTEC